MLISIQNGEQFKFIILILEVSTGPKFPARPANCFVRSGPELIQNLYNGLNRGGGNTHENFIKYGYNLWFN